jgi:hypothetical protein
MPQLEFPFMQGPRDVLHMERVLLRVLRAWAEVPHLRFGQFMAVTFNEDFHDQFGCEDERLMELMAKVIQAHQ